jgi:hypothetical protein
MNLAISGKSDDLNMVSTPNAHFVMYARPSDVAWSWAKQLSCVNDNLVSMTFRGDGQRLALYFSSQLLIVMNTADGSVVQSLKETSGLLTCTNN